MDSIGNTSGDMILVSQFLYAGHRDTNKYVLQLQEALTQVASRLAKKS